MGRTRSSVEEVLYRIAREVLHNVVEHGHATHARVRLAIMHDGTGVAAPPAARTRGGGHGLTSMVERASEAGGALRVTNAPGAGTTIEITLPTTPAVRR